MSAIDFELFEQLYVLFYTGSISHHRHPLPIPLSPPPSLKPHLVLSHTPTCTPRTGWFESSCMVLMYKLETIEPPLFAQPFPRSFPHHSQNYPCSAQYFVGVSTLVRAMQLLNLPTQPANQQQGIESQQQTPPQQQQQQTPQQQQANFSGAVHEFLHLYETWSGHKEGMDISIQQIKR